MRSILRELNFDPASLALPGLLRCVSNASGFVTAIYIGNLALALDCADR